LTEEGPREKFDSLYRAYAGRVFAYALRRSDPETAGDIVADTFLTAWRRLDAIPRDALPWLFAVAKNVLANRRRAIRRDEALSRKVALASRYDVASDPSEQVGRQVAIRVALGRLGQRDREALMLVAWDGLSASRAAAAMGCSSAAFAVRLHRARRRLTKELAAGEQTRDEPLPNQDGGRLRSTETEVAR
jgi:RNA polymerase sigma factor (sigma-70 family)